MRACTLCGQTKPLDQFYPDRRRRDGHQSWCKPCQNQAGEHRPGRIAQQRRQRREQPEKRAAYRAVYRAVKSGRLVRPGTCERCGAPGPEAHHDDYARRLDVTWLCRSCHLARHRAVAL